MKFLQLKEALEQAYTDTPLRSPAGDGDRQQADPIPPYRCGPFEKVVGGEIPREPVDYLAAKLLFKSPWINKPPPQAANVEEPEPPKKKRKRKHKNMSNHGTKVDDMVLPAHPIAQSSDYVSPAGVQVKIIGGKEYFNVDDINRLIIEKIEKFLPGTIDPMVQRARTAVEIVRELMQGMGGQMEDFEATSKIWLTDLQQTKYAITAEIKQMITGLKDVRAFLAGPNHEQEVSRLKEFVGLCERLQKLQKDGFLDAVSDTILKLNVTP